MNGTIVKKLLGVLKQWKFYAIFDSPNRYFTENSLWVPLNNTTEADYDGPKLFLGGLFLFLCKLFFYSNKFS